jgi:hypothetical protein
VDAARRFVKNPRRLVRAQARLRAAQALDQRVDVEAVDRFEQHPGARGVAPGVEEAHDVAVVDAREGAGLVAKTVERGLGEWAPGRVSTRAFEHHALTQAVAQRALGQPDDAHAARPKASNESYAGRRDGRFG